MSCPGMGAGMSPGREQEGGHSERDTKTGNVAAILGRGGSAGKAPPSSAPSPSATGGNSPGWTPPSCLGSKGEKKREGKASTPSFPQHGHRQQLGV